MLSYPNKHRLNAPLNYNGWLAATVTHDYSPNTLAYQDDITREGSFKAKEYTYKQFIPDADAEGVVWLNSYVRGDIYGSTWSGNPDPGSIEEPKKPWRYDVQYYDDVTKVPPNSCIYLGAMSVDAGVIGLPTSHFGFSFLATEEFGTEQFSRVYANSGTTYHYTG